MNDWFCLDGSVFNTLNVGSEFLESKLHALIASIEMIDAVDGCFATRGEPGENEACGGTEIGSHDRSAYEFTDAGHHNGGADACAGSAHAEEFGDMKETVGEDFLCHDGVTISEAKKSHELSLEVSREAGVWLSDDVGRLKTTSSGNANSFSEAWKDLSLRNQSCNGGTGWGCDGFDGRRHIGNVDANDAKTVEGSGEGAGWEVFENDVAIGYCGGDDVGASFDTVGHNGVSCACEGIDAFDCDDG